MESRKMLAVTYLQGRNGSAEVEWVLWTRLGKKSGMNGESSIDVYALPCAKYIAGESCWVTQGSQPRDLMT